MSSSDSARYSRLDLVGVGTQQLSRKATRLIEARRRKDEVFISSFSVCEAAMLVAKGRLELGVDLHEWIAESEVLPGTIGARIQRDRVGLRSTFPANFIQIQPIGSSSRPHDTWARRWSAAMPGFAATPT